MKLYVGNLHWGVTEADLKELFGSVGEVIAVTVVTATNSGRSGGFGFVEMSREDGQRAITELSGREILSQPLRISEAVERQRTPTRRPTPADSAPGRG